MRRRITPTSRKRVNRQTPQMPRLPSKCERRAKEKDGQAKDPKDPKDEPINTGEAHLGKIARKVARAADGNGKSTTLQSHVQSTLSGSQVEK